MAMGGTLAQISRLEEFTRNYKEWIKEMVDPAGMYDILLDRLFEYEFVWIIPNDENRAEDGAYLRVEFADRCGEEFDPSYIDWPCSVLEMMVALSIKAENAILYDSEKGDQTSRWFWEMIENLGLSGYDDVCWMRNPKNVSLEVDYIIDRFLNRKYTKTGKGGLFPLGKRAKEDQRKLEIWWQMHEYFG